GIPDRRASWGGVVCHPRPCGTRPSASSRAYERRSPPSPTARDSAGILPAEQAEARSPPQRTTRGLRGVRLGGRARVPSWRRSAAPHQSGRSQVGGATSLRRAARQKSRRPSKPRRRCCQLSAPPCVYPMNKSRRPVELGRFAVCTTKRAHSREVLRIQQVIISRPSFRVVCYLSSLIFLAVSAASRIEAYSKPRQRTTGPEAAGGTRGGAALEPCRGSAPRRGGMGQSW